MSQSSSPARECAGCADRDRVIAEQARTIAEQARTVGEQARAVVELQLMTDRLSARVAELERRLGRNSGNSSMPPSSDDLPGRRRPAPKPPKPSGRRRGKQRGAPGSGLGRVEHPDERVSLVPQVCEGCGHGLAGAAEAGVLVRQQFDIPPVTVRVTEYRLHRRRCRCGCVTTATPPQGLAAAPASYGPNLQALVVYLLVVQHLPVERAALLVADLTGARPSAGFVHGMLARLAAALAETEKLIKTLVTLARVVHVDETPLRAGAAPDRAHVHVACTETLTAYHLGGRGHAAVEDFGVLPGFTGVAVHDAYTVYDRYDDCQHQLCCAHILRELVAAVEDHPDVAALRTAHTALTELIHAAATARAADAEHVSAELRDQLVTRFHDAVLDALVAIPRRPGRRQPPARNLLERLHNREADVLRFALDGYPHVPPTNNLAERDLRPHKTQQKISGRLTSTDLTTDRLTIRGYLSTARKHGVHAMDALRAAVTGNPWTPPLPAGT